MNPKTHKRLANGVIATVILGVQAVLIGVYGWASVAFALTIVACLAAGYLVAGGRG